MMTDLLSRPTIVSGEISAEEIDLFSPQAELESERRRCLLHYIAAREAYEAAEDPNALAWDLGVKTEHAIHALVACGDLPDDDTAYKQLTTFAAPWVADLFVERWMALHGNDLDYRVVVRVADQVRDLVSDCASIVDLGMADLVEAAR
jgi:hypothetical protein